MSLINSWVSFFKLFSYALDTKGPLEKKKDVRRFGGAGNTQHDAIDLRNSDGFTAGANSFIRVQNDLVDMTSTNNRVNRYKEYDRLTASIPEIDMAMTVFADEACIAGQTEIATVFHGLQRIDWITEHKKNERFPVYCYDFEKEDYTIGWAYDPRIVKHAPTVIITLDNGKQETVTPDHRILTRDGQWVRAENLKYGDKLMPFYRVRPKQELTKLKTNQFPRIYTHNKGWIHERQFIDEWRINKDIPDYKIVNRASRLICDGLNVREMAKAMDHQWVTIEGWLKKTGFNYKELRYLSKKYTDYRNVIGVHAGPTIDVYDLSVEEHENFCTNSIVMHNCQKNEDGQVLKIECDNQEVVEELEFLYFDRSMLNLNQRSMWDKCKRLFVKGDAFWEIIINPDNPKEGVYALADLPPESMYRIETTKGKVLEFQQAKEGPDYQAIQKAPVNTATETELAQSYAIRFTPEQIIHTRLGDFRKTFYPYGVSLIEAARGPAHQLRMMEDSMVVYRLCIRTYDKIKIQQGWKYMKDIRVGDTVYSYNPNSKKLENAEVIWHEMVGTKKTYKVRSKHTSVTGTSAHPILVYNKTSGETDYVKIKDIVPGGHCFLRPKINEYEPKKINRYYKNVFANLDKCQKDKYKLTKYADKKSLIEQSLTESGTEINKKTIQKCWSFLVSQDTCSVPLTLGEKLCENFGLGEPVKKNKGERNAFRIDLPAYVTEDFAMLFGFLLGDGCINWHKNSAKLLFAAGEYQDLNEKYCDLLTKFFGRCHFQQDKRIKEGLGGYCVNSVTACEILENMGFKGDCYTKRVPEWIFTERPEIRMAFVKGFADAEGDKRGMAMNLWRATIRLCNKELVEDIKELWESLGYHASEVKKINEPDHWIKGVFVPEGVSWEIYISETEVPFHDEIISISEEGEEEVYDLTVEHGKEHNFLCNGVPVSNSRAPERRVFYIDLGQLPSFKAEAFMDRMKDQFKKKKVVSGRGGTGASAVEERYHTPSQDEDIWIPIRQNSNTRVETLPGAQNLGEIDDAVYFRNKLFTALNFPKNYFSSEDPNATRITLSAQDVKFARLIERLQSYIEDSLWEVADRHLRLRGFPQDSYKNLKLKMTPPSDWRELSRAEVVTNRINNANGLKGSQLMSDFDILTKWMKYTEDEANEMISRMKIQKLEDLKLQVLAQNPGLLGVGVPGQGEQEMGAEPGGPNPMLGPPGQQMPPMEGQPPMPQGPPMPPPPQQGMMPPAKQAKPLPDPSDEEISLYDLEIQDYDADQDEEDIDYSEAE